MDEEPVGKPYCLQKGPDGKIRGRTKEELKEMSVKAIKIRVDRKLWKKKVSQEILGGVRPSDILKDIFKTDADPELKQIVLPIKIRTFLQTIPGIGAKKAETLLVIAQIFTSKGKHDRRLSYLVKEPIRNRLIEALDAWYDQYEMEKSYKRKRDKLSSKTLKKKKIQEPEIIKEEK